MEMSSEEPKEAMDVDVDEKIEPKSSDQTEKKDEEPEKLCEHEATENLLEDQHEGTVICLKCGVVVVEQTICGISEWNKIGDDGQPRSRLGDVANRFLSSGANLSTGIR